MSSALTRSLSNLETVRAEFPMIETRHAHHSPLIYLDSAATTYKPICVCERIANYYRESCSTVHRALYSSCHKTSTDYEAVRDHVKTFIGASQREEVVFTRGTTESLNLVASGLASSILQEGDAILVAETEHHANLVPWQQLADRHRLTLYPIPVDNDGVLVLERYAELLKRKVKVVAVAHISNTTGTIHPIETICTMAHQYGAYVVVDGAQAAPHIPLQVEQMGVDFYAFSGHKLYGPSGVGVLYGKHELLTTIPPLLFGGNMIEEVSFEQITFQPPPLKFEAGTPPIEAVLGLGAALEYLTSFDSDEILDYEQRLTTHALDRLSQIPSLHVLGPLTQRGSLISFTTPLAHPLDIATLCDLQGIALRSGHLCAQPTLTRFGLSALARISFALYTTIGEIDRFADTLQEILLQLNPASHNSRPTASFSLPSDR